MANTVPSKNGGPPTVMTPERIERLELLCRHKLRLEDVAEIMKVSTRTIQRYIEKNYEMDYVTYRNQKMAPTRLMVAECLFDAARKGNVTAAIWLSKALLGWSENPKDIEGEEKKKTSKIDMSKLSKEEREVFTNLYERIIVIEEIQSKNEA